MSINPLLWKPVGGQVVLLDDPKEEKVNGIFMPGNAEGEKIIHGTVIAKSPFLLEDGRWMDPPFNVWDRVAYSSYSAAGNITKVNDKIYRLAKWNEVLAVLIEEKHGKKS